MGRLSRSWAILKASAGVLKSDKELVVIPLVGFIATITVVVAMGGVAWVTVDQTNTVTAGTTSTEYSPTPVTYVVGVLGYLLSTFVGIFFTSALVAGAHQRLRGGNPTIGSAMGAAFAKIGQIFLWSLVVTTVGLILQLIEERLGFIGTIIANLLGMAWRIVTWLAIPIIVVEGIGPFAALKRSGSLFKKTWGENLVAQLGFGLLGFIAIFAGLIVAGAVAFVVPLAGIGLGILWVAAVMLILSALNGIYRAALYEYASTGEVPATFPQEALAGAFRKRSGIRKVVG
jgi:hypothetical protein